MRLVNLIKVARLPKPMSHDLQIKHARQGRLQSAELELFHCGTQLHLEILDDTEEVTPLQDSAGI